MPTSRRNSSKKSSRRRVSRSTVNYADLVKLTTQLQYLKGDPEMEKIAGELELLLNNAIEDVQTSNNYQQVIKKYKPGMLKYDLSQLVLERVRGKMWKGNTNKNFSYELFKKIPRSTLEEIVLEPSDIKARKLLYNVRDKILKRYLRHYFETKYAAISHWLWDFWYGYSSVV